MRFTTERNENATLPGGPTLGHQPAYSETNTVSTDVFGAPPLPPQIEHQNKVYVSYKDMCKI